MSEQRTPASRPRRVFAGLIVGLVAASAGPFMGAVADRSGSEPWEPARYENTSEVRRGAEARWTVDVDDDRFYDYRVWVWQAAEVSGEAGTSRQGAGLGWKGQAVAARRLCVAGRGCAGFEYWRGPAGAATAPAAQGNLFWMDPATGIAHFEGELAKPTGHVCRVVMDWQPDDPRRTTIDTPTGPANPHAAISRWNRTAGTVGCWGSLPETTASKAWINYGL